MTNEVGIFEWDDGEFGFFEAEPPVHTVCWNCGVSLEPPFHCPACGMMWVLIKLEPEH